MENDYQCKTASINDIDLMLSWARAEGWNPGLNDSLPLLVADPAGFFMGFLNDVPIASIAAIRYPNHFGFIGLYIVKAEYRGQGFGLKLWNHAMQYLAGYNIGLDGVVTAQDNYRKSGFSLAYRNIRFSGLPTKIKNQSSLVDVKNLPLDKIFNYDQALFPTSRAPFLSAWLSMPNSKSLAVMKNNQLQGYGLIRKCYEGYKIGPLHAENFATAENLLLGLCEHAEQGPIFLDVPEINPDAIKLAEQFNLKPMFETARMYTQCVPKMAIHKIFGLTTLEIG